MARLVGPDEGSRLAFQVRADNALGSTAGLPLTVYSDAAGTTPADILTYPAGAPIPGALLTMPATTLIPLFQFPDGVKVLYASCNAGPVVPIYPRVSDRLDALESGGSPWSFNVVAQYGAVGDGVTDDTPAFVAAVADAVAYAVAHSGAAEVYIPVPPVEYRIAGAPVQQGLTHGNAQIPIPVIGMTANKVVLRIRGAVDASAMPIWTQTTRQRSGVVLRSTISATDTSGTIGEASVIGGPTPQQGYGSSAATFSNIHVIIEGVEIQVPNTAHGADMSGIDLRGCAQATIRHSAVLVDQPPTSITVGQGSGWAFGVALPWPGNNDLNNVDDVSVQGFTYGFHLTEHLSAPAIRAIYCFTAFTIIGSFENSSGSQHVAWIGNASAEVCNNGIQFVQGGKAVVAALSVEGTFGGAHIADTNGLASGYVGLGGIINTISVSDPTNVRVEYIDGTSGTTTPPAVPSSGTALRNPFWRDCAVHVSGGTVTAIAVDGQTLGVTSGLVMVPTGRKITLTYSAAPTWHWTRL
ncbi:MAG TPA: hypothetical protein VL652_34650 [Kutzneria sp.]|jgi:hypothetical protein|nr:hypothetical protein [Kutzneria sp.]